MRRNLAAYARFACLTAVICSLVVLAACGIGNRREEPTPTPSATAPAAEAAEEMETPTPEPEPEPEPLDATVSALGTQLDRIDAGLPEAPQDRDGFFSEPPESILQRGRIYYAVVRADSGDIIIQLFADRTPVTANNFVYLALTGFYDGTTFHRVIEDFMAQGGDPTGSGRGGPGYTFEDEFVGNLTFDRPYLLAMANAGPGTNGSQFFITFGPTTHLNMRHSIFGEVIGGHDAVDSITDRDPGAEGAGDLIEAIDIYVSDDSFLPPPDPTPIPPTPTPTPTPYAPHQALATDGERPLASLSPRERKSIFNSPPDTVIEEGQPYYLQLESNYGSMRLELFPGDAFVGVNNLAALAQTGFFDGTPILYQGRIDAVILGSLDGTTEGVAGYTLPLQAGRVQSEPPPGLLFYLPDFGDPSLVQAGILLLAAQEMEPGEMSARMVIGAITQGWETLEAWRTNADALLESVNVVAGEAGPAEPRPDDSDASG